ncbi:MAG: hypothetical protein MJE12_11930 [Alphaproteobacteria bacterium]|nr:hypothetical protein [Alphaproteobacteria bacterium]
MDGLLLARALHVLAVVHWIGGVTMVTLVIMPAVMRFAEPSRRLALFEAVERRFAFQARISVTVVGLTGFYMTYELDAWDRFADLGFWWMHAMVVVWAVFTVVLFVAEPLFLHDWFHRRAERDPDATFAFVHRAHVVLMSLSWVTIVAAVLGANGFMF